MKSLNQYVKECIQKNKPDTFIVSENNNKYCPKTKDELTDIIKELTNKGITDLNCIDTSKITDMRGLFATELSKIDNIDISKWDVSNVTNMQQMFSSYKKFNCDLSNWDVSNVTDMASMFTACENFEGKGLDKWDTISVEEMEMMFSYCTKFNADLSNWEVGNINDFSYMFSHCSNFEGKGLDKWNTENARNMSYMFNNCKKFDCDLTIWDVRLVDDFEGMFDGCNKLKFKPSWYKE